VIQNAENIIAMKKMLFIFWSIIPLSVFADEVVFSKSYGGSENDFAYSIGQTSDGGFIVCGQTDSYGNGKEHSPDMWIIKLDEKGTKVWDKTFGGMEGDVAYSVRQTNDLGYVIAGTTSSFGKGYPSMWIIKLDAKGDSLWSVLFEGSIVSSAHSVGLTGEGGYIVAGKGKENILKLDKNGNKEWGQHYGWIIYSVEQTRDGGYIAAGDSVYKQLEWDYLPSLYIIKLDKNGNKEWSNPLGNNFLGSVFDIHQTSDGGYILSGDSIAKKSEYDHSHHAMSVKLDRSGEVRWKYFGSEYSGAENISQTADGAYIMAGNTIDNEHGLNILIVRLDQNGKENWTRSYGNLMQWEYASSIQPASDGGYVVAGQTESFGAGKYDWWILKLDGNGNLEPTGTFDPVESGSHVPAISCIYPNPFKKSTTLVLNLPEPGFVRLTVYDIFGKKKETLFEGNLPPGETKMHWTPENQADGVYICHLYHGDYVETQRIVMLK